MTHPARKKGFCDIHTAMQREIDNGFVRETTKGDLRLYCYTQKCNYERAWNEITVLARGLIVDIRTMEIVATPFPKFFNLNERPDEPLPDEPFQVFEKLDGSLIILFHHEGEWKTATKGSLNSDQSIWAYNWIQGKNLDPLIKGVTYLCEVIYPENKIVIPYEKQGLTLLAAYHADGLEVAYDTLIMTAQMLNWDIAELHDYDSIAELVETAGTLPAYKEGFVLRFKNGHRIKIKGDEYCRIHRLISNVTPLAIWDMMRCGDNLKLIKKELPEEFWADFDNIKGRLMTKYIALSEKIVDAVNDVKDLSDKEVGLRLNSFPEDVRSFIFIVRKNGLTDSRFIDRIFRAIRPTNNQLEGYIPSTNVLRVQDDNN